LGIAEGSSSAWRIRIFAVTWLAYAGFYFCRKNFSVVMPMLVDSAHYSKVELANLIFLYSLMYAAGQPLLGSWSDRWGARLLVSAGMLTAVFSNFAMVGASSLLLLAPLVLINGLGQSAGWPGLVQLMANWFGPHRRGIVMGWWSTNYVLGSFLATIFATFAATRAIALPGSSWQRGFWVPALLLLVITIFYAALVRNRPSEAGLPEIHEVVQATPGEPPLPKGRFRNALANRVIWTIAIGVLFAKVTRYAFLFWLPLYMTEQLGYSPERAGYTAGLFELAGFAGALLAGYLSDKVFGSRRFPVTAIMFWLLAVICLIHPAIAAKGYIVNSLSICLIGVANFGPDTLLQGAASQDVGSGVGAGAMAGFISGFGSIGQLFSPYLVAMVAAQYGWNALFHLFVVVALVGGLLQATLWGYGRQIITES
jgi:OPA family glycerol-3-phosphate transporter-like MFS transporter